MKREYKIMYLKGIVISNKKLKNKDVILPSAQTQLIRQLNKGTLLTCWEILNVPFGVSIKGYRRNGKVYAVFKILISKIESIQPELKKLILAIQNKKIRYLRLYYIVRKSKTKKGIRYIEEISIKSPEGLFIPEMGTHFTNDPTHRDHKILYLGYKK